MTVTAFLAVVSTSSAVTIGVNWRGNSGTEDIESAQRVGATVYHLPLGYNATSGGRWSSFDGVVEAAWKRGITILPTLIRSNAEGNRFLLNTDPDWFSWGAWAREAVERYGINGSFWNGKPNPTPITAWEVWNEPNLIENNPKRSEGSCKALGQGYNAAQGTCIQPQSYGTFLSYTAEQIQAGSLTKTGHGTDVLFGGLYLPGGEGSASFLTKAAPWGGLDADVTGVAIHPYSFVSGAAGVPEEVNGVRGQLNGLGAGEKTLWLTELGWPVSGSEGFPTNGHPLSEAEQASALTESFNWIKASAAADKIQFVAWFSIGDYNTGAHWDGFCGLLRSDGSYRPAWYAYQQEAGVEGTGTQYTAFQANNNELWYYLSTTGLGVGTGAGMDPGTSPSAVSMPRGGDMIAFQDWHHELWIHNTITGSSTSTGVGMNPGTSPSIAYIPGGGYLIALQDWHHELWTYSTATGTAFDTTLGMEEGSSPVIAAKPDGSYVIAFQANNHELWYYPSTTGLGVPTGIGMDPGASPGIALDPGGGYRIAFEDWHHELWTYATASGSGATTGAGMDPETSPSIAFGQAGSYAVAFEDWHHELWIYSPTAGATTTGAGMDPGTSPSIRWIPSAGFKVAFQDWRHELWNYSLASGIAFDTTLGMEEGTSPSLTVH